MFLDLGKLDAQNLTDIGWKKIRLLKIIGRVLNRLLIYNVETPVKI